MIRSLTECDGCGEPLDGARARGELMLTLNVEGTRETRTADLCAQCFTKAATAARATFVHAPIGPLASGLDKLAAVVDEQRKDHNRVAAAIAGVDANLSDQIDSLRTELAAVREDVRRTMMGQGGCP